MKEKINELIKDSIEKFNVYVDDAFVDTEENKNKSASEKFADMLYEWEQSWKNKTEKIIDTDKKHTGGN